MNQAALQTRISLDGRGAIVTGARRGIGYCEALALGQAGAKVVVVTHSQPAEAERVAAEIVATGGDAFAAQADITSSERVRTLVDTTLRRYGRLDILVNNAGVMADPSDRRKLVDLNAIAPGFISTEQLLTNASPELLAAYKEQNPLGRLGQPVEVANLVLFLASEGASYINGAVVDCTGGRMEYHMQVSP